MAEDDLRRVDTFVEIGAFQQSEAAYLPEKKRLPGDGVVTGYGKINGRLPTASWIRKV